MDSQIYVFALHATENDTADHRDATQWRFYVVPSSKLPQTKSITLPKLKALSAAHRWDGLFEAVEQQRLALEQS
jgi:hypothetical protein